MPVGDQYRCQPAISIDYEPQTRSLEERIAYLEGEVEAAFRPQRRARLLDRFDRLLGLDPWPQGRSSEEVTSTSPSSSPSGQMFTTDPKELPDKRKVRSSKEVAATWARATKGPDSEQAAQILKAVRDRAEAWRTGTAVVLALITAALVLGGETFKSISEGARVTPAVPVLIVFAAVLALSSLYFTLRAAHGPAFLDTKVRETVEVAAAQRDMIRAGGAAWDLKLAQGLLGGAVVLFLAALMTMWLATPPP